MSTDLEKTSNFVFCPTDFNPFGSKRLDQLAPKYMYVLKADVQFYNHSLDIAQNCTPLQSAIFQKRNKIK